MTYLMVVIGGAAASVLVLSLDFARLPCVLTTQRTSKAVLGCRNAELRMT